MSGNHGENVHLDEKQKKILINGIQQVLDMAKGLQFKPFPSEKYPLPMTLAEYGHQPETSVIMQEIQEQLHQNPVHVLEQTLVLLELIESNQPDRTNYFIKDGTFLGISFNSKRCNGWAFVLGQGDHKALTQAVNQQWQFEFFIGGADKPSGAFWVPSRPTAIYYLINMLARYAFVYGRKKARDSHDIGHFIEDFAPGVLICHGAMTDLDWTLALAAMKMGVPALVPPDFPFTLGRKITYHSTADIVDGITQFPNSRKLLQIPGLTQLPEYCNGAYRNEDFKTESTVGDTDISFYLLRRGAQVVDGVETKGTPQKSLGIIITAENEQLTDMDCRYIGADITGLLSRIKGIRPAKEHYRLVLNVGNGQTLDPVKIGEVLHAGLKHEYPKIKKAHVTIIGDESLLQDMADTIRKEIDERARQVDKMDEDSIAEFNYCVGCSPFAPDHVCVLTPDRVPQCGRSFMQIRTGALFGYDDMSNIHHRVLHKDINSFGVLPKGTCLDPAKGEWTGINEYAQKLTAGRVPKVYLHTIFDHPTTGCGCFRNIIFSMKNSDGIGIMHSGFEGKAPDGRRWIDLKYELAGKQTSGVSGCANGYFFSPKFLQGDGGWKRVQWVTKKVWDVIKNQVPAGHRIKVEDQP
jgi:acetyl-CoA decarbonylase/synthase complex subunit beta